MTTNNSFTQARQLRTMPTPWGVGILVLGLTIATHLPQQAAAQNTPEFAVEPALEQTLDRTELDTLVGPIALYPDDLVGIILPASTYPLQIVQAARFLDDLEENPELAPDPEWDNAVVALLNYPEVLRTLDADLDWTWELGQAVLNQQSDVIDAIQAFRERAYLAGNLVSDDRQTVSEDDGVIEIAPADPEVIYIPYYEPAQVVVVQPRRVYHYYDYPYPVYYYPYPVGYSFSSPFFWGVTSAFSIGWHTHYLHVYHQSHFGHPYYRYPYYSPYYARRGVNVNINLSSVSHIWRPEHRRVARPYYGAGDARRIVRSTEDYTRDLRRARYERLDTTGDRARQPRQPNRPAQAETVRNGTRFATGSTPARTQSRAVNDSRSRRVQDTSSTPRTTEDGRGAAFRQNPRRVIGSIAGGSNDRGRVGNVSRPSPATALDSGAARRQSQPRAPAPLARSSRAVSQAQPAQAQRTHTFAAPPRRQADRQAAPATRQSARESASARSGGRASGSRGTASSHQRATNSTNRSRFSRTN